MGERICVGIALTHEPRASRERLLEFCGALAAAARVEITGRTVSHYDQLVDDLARGRIDLAWLPPIVAVRARDHQRVDLLAIPVRDGASTYSTALFTRSDSAICTIDDLKGKRAAWVDRFSASGYVVIRATLHSLGIDLDEAFSTNWFVGTHDEVARVVMAGYVDVGATFARLGGSDEASAKNAGWGVADVRIIESAGPIPSDVLVASPKLPMHVSAAITNALVSFGSEPLRSAAEAMLGAEGFVQAKGHHFEPLEALLLKLADHH